MGCRFILRSSLSARLREKRAALLPPALLFVFFKGKKRTMMTQFLRQALAIRRLATGQPCDPRERRTQIFFHLLRLSLNPRLIAPRASLSASLRVFVAKIVESLNEFNLYHSIERLNVLLQSDIPEEGSVRINIFGRATVTFWRMEFARTDAFLNYSIDHFRFHHRSSNNHCELYFWSNEETVRKYEGKIIAVISKFY